MPFDSCVTRLRMAEVQPGVFREAERSRTVLIVTDAVCANAAMRRCAEDLCSEVCHSAELDGTGAECSAMTPATVHTPRYYGVDTTPLHSRRTSPVCSTVTSEARPRSASAAAHIASTAATTPGDGPSFASDATALCSSCGGVEILDSVGLCARKLLALRASEIQSQQRRGPAMVASRELVSVAEDGAVTSDELGLSGTLEAGPPSRRPALTLQEAWDVLQRRRRDAADSHAATLPAMTALCDALRHEDGALCVKAPLAAHGTLIEQLQLHTLFFAAEGESSGDNAMTATSSQTQYQQSDGFLLVRETLLLQPYSYLPWLQLSEPTAGTRSHVNAMGCHAWHILLRGTKHWVVADALDKHLLTDPDTGAVADLSRIDPAAFPNAQHAKLHRFTQHAGEAVFIPADTLHLELAAGADGEDALCVALLVQFMDGSSVMNYEKHSCLNALLPQAHRTVDLLMPKVLPYTTVDLVLFDDNVYPSFRGKTRCYRPEVKQRVVVLRAMTRFAQVALPFSDLGARVELEALQGCFGVLGRELLTKCSPPAYVTGVPKGYLDSVTEHHLALYYFVEPPSLASVRACLATLPASTTLQYFDRPDVSLPAIKLFRSTCSHQGRIPNYVPLSVLLDQRWDFEHELCRRLTSVPSIILAKAYHPQGFIRPGSVWHYSRFQFTADAHGVLQNSETDEVACGPVATTPTASTTSLSSELVQQCGKGSCGWCRTFLFFCCPLLERPVALHPVSDDPALQKGHLVGRRGVAPEFYPRLVELEWNVDSLEEYGLVKLIQLEEDDCDEVRRTVVQHPCFAAFERFVDSHCMHAGGHTGAVRVERVMSAVLWFLCTPCVVGYVGGVGAGAEDGDGNDGAPTQQQTICLTAGAASTLLSCVPHSFYAELVTRLCNWLCDVAADCTPAREAGLFELVAHTLREGTVEAEAIIFQVLDVKRRNLQRYGRPDHVAALRGGVDDVCADHEAAGLAREDKLVRLERFCAEVQQSR